MPNHVASRSQRTRARPAEVGGFDQGAERRCSIADHEERSQRQIPVQQRPRQSDQHGQQPEDQQHLSRAKDRLATRPLRRPAWRPQRPRLRPAWWRRGASSGPGASSGHGWLRSAGRRIRSSLPARSAKIFEQRFEGRCAAEGGDHDPGHGQGKREHDQRSRGSRRASLEDAGQSLQNQGGLAGAQQQHLSRRDRQSGQIFADREQERLPSLPDRNSIARRFQPAQATAGETWFENLREWAGRAAR